MPDEPKQPWLVSISQALVGAAAPLVPAAQREDWRREWSAEIWHRWQFLFHTGEWNKREKALLLWSTLGAFADAAWLLATQDSVRSRMSGIARSPFTFLAVLAALVLGIAAASSGVHATRQMLFSQMPSKAGQLTFIWMHQYIGGGDKGLPADVVPAWQKSSKLLNGVAGVVVSHRQIALNGRNISGKQLVVHTNPALFDVLGAQAEVGRFPAETGVVLDHRAWVKFANGRANVLGSEVKINGQSYHIAAILPAKFEFLSRQPTFYLVDRLTYLDKAFIVARVKPGVNEEKLNKELTRISAEICGYYYLQGQMRFSTWRGALLTPLISFGLATLLSSVVAWMALRPRLRQMRLAFETGNRQAALRRMAFFLSKTGLGLACVFLACLEWSRSASSVVLASFDPGSGPFLLWLYVLGTMGVLFWAVADQRARCRVCLRLMAFPVRIGCPGCLLLDWSGTELFCSEGHGLLHVPLMAPSWDEEADRWVSLDDSWKGLFAQENSQKYS